MGSITVLGHALKVVNKGGGYPTKTIIQKWESPPDFKEGVKRYKRKVRYQAKEKQPGSDYVVFECPMCGRRNKQVMYNAKESSQDGRVVFRCNRCYHDIALQRPIGLIDSSDKFISMGPVILGPDGKPIER